METILKCKHCDEEFRPTRTNQVFCSANCRNTYHNKLAFVLREKTKSLTSKLNQNRKILKKLYEQEEDVLVSKDFLLGAGYCFDLLTHTLQDKNKVKFHFSFEYGIGEVETNKFSIIFYEKF